ncbi:Integrator complex subunit 4 [Branchiostoma belcheri]|nr:Integrator complex subunit 4 [Branchiostoma belcheri]
MAAHLKKRAYEEFSHVIQEEVKPPKKLKLARKPSPEEVLDLSTAKTTQAAVQLLLKFSNNLPDESGAVEGAVRHLLEFWYKEKESYVRSKIAQLLGRLAHTPGFAAAALVDDLTSLLQAEESHQVRAQLLDSLLQIGRGLPLHQDLHRKLVTIAQQFLTDTYHLVRSKCLELIGCLGTAGVAGKGDLAVERILADASHDQDPRVRTSALQAMLTLHQRGLKLSLGGYQQACSALTDDYEGVRLAAVKLIWVYSQLYPETMIPVPSSNEELRLVDDGFAKICNMVNDLTMTVRAEAAGLLGSLHRVSERFLEQTLDKKLMSHLRRKRTAHERAKELYARGEWSTGKKWGDDAPKEEVDTDSISLIDSGACGAFVHGLEDEFLEVRNASVDSLCELSSNNPTFAHQSLDFLVDMLNDEIDGVRLNSIRSLRKISRHVVLREDQLDTVLEAEKEKVRVALRHCGYPEWALREGENNSRKDKSSKEQSKTGKQEQLPASYVVLPYIHGVTERLKRVYAKHNVSLYSKPGFTLRNALVRPKDPLAPGEKCGVIYKIKCEECGEVYVGETERSLGERTSEHQKSLHQKDCKSALSQHQLQAGHNITTRPISDIIEIIDQESRNPHRKIKEAVHIQLEGAKLNRTEGRRRGVGPDRPMQVSGLVSRSREIRPLREQDGLIAIENLEDASKPIREALHELLCSCQQLSKACLNSTIHAMLRNLSKYPSDRLSIWRCMQQVGSHHADLVATLTPDLLCAHPYFDATEPDMDDPAYIAILILVFNAAVSCPTLQPMFPQHTLRHYDYLRDSLTELVPQLKLEGHRSILMSPDRQRRPSLDDHGSFLQHILSRLGALLHMQHGAAVELLQMTIRDLERVGSLEPQLTATAACTAMYLHCHMLFRKALSDQLWAMPAALGAVQCATVRASVRQMLELTHQMEQLFLGLSSEEVGCVLQMRLKAHTLQLLVDLRGRQAGAKGTKTSSQLCELYLQRVTDVQSYLISNKVAADSFTQALLAEMSMLESSKASLIAKYLLPLIQGVFPEKSGMRERYHGEGAKRPRREYKCRRALRIISLGGRHEVPPLPTLKEEVAAVKLLRVTPSMTWFHRPGQQPLGGP